MDSLQERASLSFPTLTSYCSEKKASALCFKEEFTSACTSQDKLQDFTTLVLKHAPRTVTGFMTLAASISASLAILSFTTAIACGFLMLSITIAASVVWFLTGVVAVALFVSGCICTWTAVATATGGMSIFMASSAWSLFLRTLDMFVQLTYDTYTKASQYNVQIDTTQTKLK
mmetsp:Transcript_31999/g.38727  ORF Transcript_31999/g.38727 Transcript_31999/m.38727 type:complete len:173 (+) Transcript_31999:253-771(+)